MAKFTRYSRAQAERDKLEIFRQLREIGEAYRRGEVDAEGNETAFGKLVRHAQPVNAIPGQQPRDTGETS